MSTTGIVYLVGAGPGDPGLITKRGAELLAQAEVIVYDYLASPALLGLASDRAEMIYVGKKGGDHTLSQEGINDLLVDLATRHTTVVRLKGGDPFVFGRGGEEAERLVESGARVEIVPGVSSAVAAPAYAGIPITHRAHNSTVTLATGHEDPTKGASRLDWEALAKAQTLVFLMGMKRLARNSASLIEAGLDPETPAGLVRWGTTPNQRVLTATIGTIADEAEKAGFKAPAVLVVGGVVGLREKLAWFEKRPLHGLKVLITRAQAGVSRLAGMLTELGAEPISFPTVEIGPPDDFGPLREAIADLAGFDWLIFTSANGVDYFFAELEGAGLDSRALGGLKLCAIGPATARALNRFGLRADLVPREYRAEAVLAALADEAKEGRRFLLARATEAREVLPQGLAELGGRVVVAPAYKTVLPQAEDRAELAGRLDRGEIDMVIFTASSTVGNLARLYPERNLSDLLGRTGVAVIGPITGKTAEDLGLTVTVQAREYTLEGLMAALIEWRSSD